MITTLIVIYWVLLVTFSVLSNWIAWETTTLFKLRKVNPEAVDTTEFIIGYGISFVFGAWSAMCWFTIQALP